MRFMQCAVATAVIIPQPKKIILVGLGPLLFRAFLLSQKDLCRLLFLAVGLCRRRGRPQAKHTAKYKQKST